MVSTRMIAVLALGMVVAGCSPPPMPTNVLIGLAVGAAPVIATDKTIVDLGVSAVTGKNCSMVRIEAGRTYCQEDEPNPAPDVYCYRTIADVDCYALPDPRTNQPPLGLDAFQHASSD